MPVFEELNKQHFNLCREFLRPFWTEFGLFAKTIFTFWPLNDSDIVSRSLSLIRWSWIMCNHSVKFHEDLIGSFWVVLRQTDRQARVKTCITSLIEVINIHNRCKLSVSESWCRQLPPSADVWHTSPALDCKRLTNIGHLPILYWSVESRNKPYRVLATRGVYPPNSLEQVPPLPFPFPSLPVPLEVAPAPLLRLGGLGSALAPPAGPGGARPPNGIWWIFQAKNLASSSNE